ncbi:HutD family protein [Variovorax sp. J22R24]|uniref:HutD/Ves family protein n=1 Tax=Variovorax gracilis TaxID=3053502 RepID=UPI0025765E54|nr:HutD family protein [Variovorax sp. J22R24]MDM0107236.1 HutD family protein [Variovorax sp. J22R24]
MHRFDIASLSAAPWKNGGGVTREIVCSPAGAGMEGFDWRVSIATIDKPGPFSAFAGVDRVIMLLDGAGVRLRSHDGRIDYRLEVPHAPFAFGGDVALDCELLGGASTDFNVMSRRGRLHAKVRVLREGGDVAPVGRGLLLALAGRWRFNDIDCEPGSGVWWDGEIRQWQATTSDADAAMVAVRLEPTATP